MIKRRSLRAAPSRKSSHGRSKPLQPRRLSLEWLETRSMLSASTLVATPDLVVTPNVTSTRVVGHTPAQIDAAYGFGSVKVGSTTLTGAGQTIAIVDAYNDPNIASDLTAFDKQFGLAAPPNFSVVSQTGTSKLPATDSGWDLEIALDVEWAHSIAPEANILLVEASSDNLSDLIAAVNYAKTASLTVSGVKDPVSVVSMSWGSSEFSGEKSYDSAFSQTGVTFVAASGDEGAPAEWPGTSPNVLAVGGTTLNLTSTGAYSSETGWADSTGGLSSYESEPTYQNVVQSTGKRGEPDIAFDANPNSGVAVYDSVATGGQSGWFEVGGTSLGAPSWAGLIATADQGRVLNKLGTLGSGEATLYTLQAASYHDITSGNNGYTAGTGYDAVTGLGSPIANLVIQELATGTTGSGKPESTSTGLTVSSDGGGGGGGGHHHGGGFAGGGWWFAQIADPNSGFGSTLQFSSTSNPSAGFDVSVVAVPTVNAARVVQISPTTAYRFQAGGPVVDSATEAATTDVSATTTDTLATVPADDANSNQSPVAPQGIINDVDVPSAADRLAIDQIVARVRQFELTPTAVDQVFAAEVAPVKQLPQASPAAALPQELTFDSRPERFGRRAGCPGRRAAKPGRLDAPLAGPPLVPSPQLTAEPEDLPGGPLRRRSMARRRPRRPCRSDSTIPPGIPSSERS